MFGKIENADLDMESSINRNNNFGSFFQAVLVLFRSATGKSPGCITAVLTTFEEGLLCNTPALDGAN